MFEGKNFHKKYDQHVRGFINDYIHLQEIDFLNKVDINFEDSEVLDLGCGTGRLMVFCHNKGVKRIVGVDLSQYMLAKAKEKIPHANVVRASVENLPVKSKFDVILCVEVLEFTRNPRILLENLKKKLKPNGVLIIVFLNKLNILAMGISLLNRRNLISYFTMKKWVDELELEVFLEKGIQILPIPKKILAITWIGQKVKLIEDLINLPQLGKWVCLAIRNK
jgi:2-polyprenyl-3-methyl-5-hydroxy-6-metoxy-1,4-benzoquinol methylase